MTDNPKPPSLEDEQTLPLEDHGCGDESTAGDRAGPLWVSPSCTTTWGGKPTPRIGAFEPETRRPHDSRRRRMGATSVPGEIFLAFKLLLAPILILYSHSDTMSCSKQQPLACLSSIHVG